MSTNRLSFKIPIISISVFGLNLIYGLTNYQPNNALLYLSKQSPQLHFLKPVDMKKENYLVKCFNSLFCPMSTNELIIIPTLNLFFGGMFERKFGSKFALKGIVLLYIGVFINMLPCNRAIEYVEESHNAQILNYSSFAFLSMFSAGYLRLSTSLITLIVYFYLSIKGMFPYDLRASILLSFLLGKSRISQEFSYINSTNITKLMMNKRI